MTDDYRAEVLSRLNESELYQSLIQKTKDRDHTVQATIVEGVIFAYHRTKMIMRHMGEFTLHDGDHLFRVLRIMELLLTKENVEKLSVPELILLILAAFFHDIGMAPHEQEVELWMKAWNKVDVIFLNDEERNSFSDFQRFLALRPERMEEIKVLFEEGNITQADLLKGYLVSDFIRLSHADRARKIISTEKILGEKLSPKIWFRENDLTLDLANICYSHNDDPITLLNLEKHKICGQEIYACLPLIGVLLRLSDVMDFDAKRTPDILFSHLNIQHPISLLEWKKHRSVESWDIHPHFIQFTAQCEHPAIEASIREYCDTIDNELGTSTNILSTLADHVKFANRGINVKVPLRINRDKIEATKDIFNKPTYLYRPTKFTLSKKQVIDLLMGTKLYGKPEVALRELLQNSLDACLLRSALEKQWGNTFMPRIYVRLLEERGYQILEVEDNGIGMDQDIIDKYYTKVGVSFYKSADFNILKLQANTEMHPTSRFGIGILSAFMVADTLTVDTKKIYGPQDSSQAINLCAEGQDSIFWIRPGQRTSVGTTTRLTLRKGKNPWDNMTDSQFMKSVKVTVPNPPFPIVIIAGQKEELHDQESFVNIRPQISGPSWSTNENVKLLEFGFTHSGLTGATVIAILEKDEVPNSFVEIPGKIVEVEQQKYPLSKFLKMENNHITIRSTTIGTNSKGEIVTNDGLDFSIRSSSAISLHGIELPAELFPDSWSERKGQIELRWPFPIRLTVDISNPMDLDVNSARSEILSTEKWAEFREKLSFIVLYGIKQRVDGKYWSEFQQNIVVPSGDHVLIDSSHHLESDIFDRPAIFELKSPVPSIDDIDNLPF